MGMRSLINAFLGNQRGTVGIWMALATPMMVGAGAMALDMSSFYVMRGELQYTADAAALAAAKALPDLAAATAAAESYTEKNMPAEANGDVTAGTDVTPGHWNAASLTFTAGASPMNSVRVTARRAQANGNAAPTYFARALGYDSVDVAASAVAVKSNLKACIIALNPDDEKGIEVEGNASVRTYDCNIQVNSCHASDAFRAQGNVDVAVIDQTNPAGTGRINICGAAKIQGAANVSPTPNDNSGPQPADPFAAVAMPDPTLYDTAADCDFTDFSATGDVDLYPGVYCDGIRLSGNGTATFHATGGSLNDGLYIIKDGEFRVEGNINVVGDGVTFFLTGQAAELDFRGTADIGLSAPTTGPLAGFIFFGDRDNPAHEHEMRGTALGGYNGYIYLPGAELEIEGTATATTTTTDCTIVVADRMEFEGTSNFEAKSVCSDYASPAMQTVLVN